MLLHCSMFNVPMPQIESNIPIYAPFAKVVISRYCNEEVRPGRMPLEILGRRAFERWQKTNYPPPLRSTPTSYPIPLQLESNFQNWQLPCEDITVPEYI